MKSKSYHWFAWIAWIAFTFLSCKPGPQTEIQSHQPPSVGPGDGTGIEAVIEISSGTSDMSEIDPLRLMSAQTGDRMDFLPYPANYGYLRGCARIDSASGNAQPLPVMVLMASVRKGSVVPVHPIAVLVLRASEVRWPVVIATPVEPSMRTVGAVNFVDLITEYDAVRAILQTWFLNYLGREVFELAGWHDERYAYRLIAEWKINE